MAKLMNFEYACGYYDGYWEHVYESFKNGWNDGSKKRMTVNASVKPERVTHNNDDIDTADIDYQYTIGKMRYVLWGLDSSDIKNIKNYNQKNTFPYQNGYKQGSEDGEEDGYRLGFPNGYMSANHAKIAMELSKKIIDDYMIEYTNYKNSFFKDGKIILESDWSILPLKK